MGKSGRNVTLSTAIVFTASGEALTRFYQDALALGPPDSAMEDHAGWQLGGMYFGIDYVDEPYGTPPSALTVWFEVPDLEVAFHRAVAHGARPRMQPQKKSWGGYLASVTDPDGNVVGLAQRR